MMLDKIYILSYLFIIIALARAVATSWWSAEPAAEQAISRADRRFVVGLVALYLLANIAVAWTTLA